MSRLDGEADDEIGDSEPQFTTDYQILSIGPTHGMKAVYAEFQPDTGEAFLFAQPLNFLGIASVVHRMYEDGECVDSRQRNEIVGIYFEDGEEFIANDEPNFGGLCPEGEDMEDHIGALPPELFDKLPARIRKRREAQY